MGPERQYFGFFSPNICASPNDIVPFAALSSFTRSYWAARLGYRYVSQPAKGRLHQSKTDQCSPFSMTSETRQPALSSERTETRLQALPTSITHTFCMPYLKHFFYWPYFVSKLHSSRCFVATRWLRLLSLTTSNTFNVLSTRWG